MQALHPETSDSPSEAVYTELVRVPAMSVGMYRLPAGCVDPQQPHSEDEVYVIIEGRGILRAASGNAPAHAGTALFVPAGEPHSFVDITEDLLMYVVFGPAESRRESAS